MRELLTYGKQDSRSAQGWMFRAMDGYWNASFDPGYGTYDHSGSVLWFRAVADDFGNLVNING